MADAARPRRKTRVSQLSSLDAGDACERNMPADRVQESLGAEFLSMEQGGHHYRRQNEPQQPFSLGSRA
jgi:hypothetical protein